MNAAGPPLEVSSAQDGRWTLITVSGDLDISTVVTLFDAVNNSNGDVAIDLADLRFVDSSGLSTLLEIRSERTLILVTPSNAVIKLLKLAQLSDAFTVGRGVGPPYLGHQALSSTL